VVRRLDLNGDGVVEYAEWKEAFMVQKEVKFDCPH
jgi:hypothetical protein